MSRRDASRRLYLSKAVEMAKRQRKTEQDYLRARGALMRSIQRTNKAFGSNIKISDIVDVPTPAQAKKMSAAELRKMTRRIQSARTDKGQKMTFVPTGTGQVTKVPTKNYNAAMSNLGKRNKALRERLDTLSSAVLPKGRGARPVSARSVQSGYGQSKITPVNELDPMTAFIGGKARGNVDEIRKRFEERGKKYGTAPREWTKRDELMRKNFEKLISQSGNDALIKKFKSLSDRQLLWATYEGNLPAFLEAAGYADYRYKARSDKPNGGLERGERDGLAAAAANIVEDIISEASRVRFK